MNGGLSGLKLISTVKRGVQGYTWSIEISCVLLIAYAFVTDIAWTPKVLFVLSTAFFVAAVDAIYAHIRYQTGHAAYAVCERLRYNHLAMRFAIDGVAEQARLQEPLKPDWEAAIHRASNDIVTDDSAQAMAPAPVDELGFISSFVSVPLGIAINISAGYGAAWWLKTHAPEFVKIILSPPPF